MKRFDGKVVVITGAASGIGRATALAFAREGAKLYLTDINQQALEGFKEELRAKGAAVSACVVDSRDQRQMRQFADAVSQAEGRVDVLCNNAGIGYGAPAGEQTLEDWKRVIDINLWGVIHGIHAFLPVLERQGGDAHIVNVASMAGLIGFPGLSAYCTTKFAVVGLSESLAAELAVKHIRVTAICPGVVNTAIVESASIAHQGRFAKDSVARFYQRFGANPEKVARDILKVVGTAVVIKPSVAGPAWLLWWLKRLSTRIYGTVARHLARNFLE
ncbi:MAG: SDR family NAD(P)-dependent oxidoreductase [Bdellovibrionota bacterium]